MILMKDPDSFDGIIRWLTTSLSFYGRVNDNGEWQAKSGTPFDRTIEIEDVSLQWPIPPGVKTLQSMVEPNLPWAEDHFQERISGKPLNPPPSHEWWPFNQNSNAEHRPDGDKFSHTYPERFWPKFANSGETRPNGRQVFVPHNGIRFEYGGLDNLIELLLERPNTRQAFLPIWFPEDLMASRLNERVPCTLGYHFTLRKNKLTCRYFMRSCDFFRYFRDDVYMAARLTQYIAETLATEQVANAGSEQAVDSPIRPGNLVMHISNLHIFEAERSRLKELEAKQKEEREQDKAQKLMQGGW